MIIGTYTTTDTATGQTSAGVIYDAAEGFARMDAIIAQTEAKEKAPVEKIHIFERAGLGKAPYQYKGMTENVYVPCPGAPGQAGGTCDYCGTGIRYEFIFVSADGKRFVVGSDCVHKSGDSGMRKVVAEELRQREAAKRAAKREEKRLAWLEENKDRLEAEKRQREEQLRQLEQERAERWASLPEALRNELDAAAKSSEFFASLRGQLYEKGKLSGRQADCIAKLFGRANSKAFNAALEIIPQW